jgi:hypothetical protein
MLAGVLVQGIPAATFLDREPGAARIRQTAAAWTLENDLLAASWVAGDNTLRLAGFEDRETGQRWELADAELFRVWLTGGAEKAGSRFGLLSGPVVSPCVPRIDSPRLAERKPGWQVSAVLRDTDLNLEVHWRAELRDGANYVRQWMSFLSPGARPGLERVDVLDCTSPTQPSVSGLTPGSPVTAAHVFLGAESPFASATLAGRRVRFAVPCDPPLDASYRCEVSCVLGVAPGGRLRRGFAYYLNQERARGYRQFMTWNSWFDFLWSVSASGMSSSMAAVDAELRQRRGVAVDAYAIDDAWDDSTRGFWAIDPAKFPRGFGPLQAQATQVQSHLGLWISPLGGYNGDRPWQDLRRAAALREGLVAADLDLSSPPYYAWWTNTCRDLIANHGINLLKWDNAGAGVSPHFMALVRSARAIREHAPDLYINASVGTWPSPFWLHSVDSIWRGGEDVSFEGEGDSREQWMTYRDGQTYANIVQKAPLFPLNSLMLHGVAHGARAEGPMVAQSGTNLLHEARSYFGSGTQLQELYVTPGWMTPQSWDDLAEAARWARAHQEILADTHWVGGDPRELQVYGWASWNGDRGTLLLRNPSSRTNRFTLDIADAFELPPDSPAFFDLLPGYAGQREPIAFLQSGVPQTVALLPFEVLAFDVVPRASFPDRARSMGPVSYWRLGSPGDSLVVDSVGSSPGWLAPGTTSVPQGALQQDDDGGVRFGGDGSGMIVSNSVPFAFGTEDSFTLSCWVRLPALEGSRTVVANGDLETGYSLELIADSTVRFASRGVAAVEAAIPPPRRDVWHHVAATYVTNRVSLYWDGMQVGAGSLPGIGKASGPLTWGGGLGVHDHGLRGDLDEALVFATALSFTQVRTLCAAGPGLSVPPQVVQPPSPANRLQGASAVFRISAIGATPLQFQWHSNGIPVPGANQSTLLLENLTPPENGTRWSVTVSNRFGGAASDSAMLHVVPPTAYEQRVLASHPAGFWELDEPSGPGVTDRAGTADGMASRQIAFAQPGALETGEGGSAHFTGTLGSQIDIPAGPTSGAAFSIECWARVTGGSGSYRSPVTSRAVDPLQGYSLYASPNNRWEFWLAASRGDAPSWQVIGGPLVEPLEWTHLVGTCDGSIARLFVNGEAAGEGVGPFASNGSRLLRIGAGATEGPGSFGFVGDIAGVASYPHALTPGEVRDHFVVALSPARLRLLDTPAGVVLQWRLGMLEQGGALAGPWSPLPEARSPWLIPFDGASAFYRLRQ